MRWEMQPEIQPRATGHAITGIRRQQRVQPNQRSLHEKLGLPGTDLLEMETMSAVYMKPAPADCGSGTAKQAMHPRFGAWHVTLTPHADVLSDDTYPFAAAGLARPCWFALDHNRRSGRHKVREKS